MRTSARHCVGGLPPSGRFCKNETFATSLVSDDGSMVMAAPPPSATVPAGQLATDTTRSPASSVPLTALLNLSWVLVVPVGPVGPDGPDGPVGPPGPVGPDDPVAPFVPAGPVGPTLPAGPVAPVGPPGPVAPPTPVVPCGPVG